MASDADGSGDKASAEDITTEDDNGASPSSSSASVATSVAASGLVVAIALGIHLEGLNHKFAFDDNYAILNNADALGHTPWADLMKHDFWGADMTKPSANKSFRPVTIAIWRLLHVYTRGKEEEPSTWWFHGLNLSIHSVVSAQVFALGRQLASIFGYRRPAVRAFVAAMLFATHPAHVEVVIGCVGLAELLCASFGIAALQLLLCDDEALTRPLAVIRTILGFFMICIATLSKEIGITLCGTLVLWDCMVLPFLRASKEVVRSKSIASEESRRKKAGGSQADKLDDEVRRRWSVLRFCIAVRTFLAVGLVVGYKYGLRSRIAGGRGDLVSSFRRQENPFAFAPDRQTLVLSLLFNHASYAWLLLFPKYLSADWSFACTGYVTEWQDARNAASAALYGTLILVLLRSRPWRIAGRILALTRYTWGDALRIEQAFFVYGLVVIPFMPMTNLFFWVGTAKAERLLYFPSLGFLLLVANLIVGGATSGISQGKIFRGILVPGRLLVVAILVAASAYRSMDRVLDWKTEEYLFAKAYEVCPNSGKVLQNMGIVMQHEHNYEKALDLFRTAHRVDPSCCDFQFFVSQTLLMQGKFEEGLPGIHESAVKCKTERQKALEILGQVMQQNRDGPFEVSQSHINTQRTVGLALLQDEETGDPPHGCHLMEQAMWSQVASTNPQVREMPRKKLEAQVKTWMDQCFNFTAVTCKREFGVTDMNATSAWKCLKGRLPVAQALLKHGRKSEQLVNAVYRYIKVSRAWGCVQNPHSGRMDELCGVERPRLAGTSYSGMVSAVLSMPDIVGAGGSHASDGHRTALHIVQGDDPYNPWFHLAWAEVLLLEKRVREGITHINVATNQLMTAVNERMSGVVPQGDDRSVASASATKQYAGYLDALLAPSEEGIIKLVKNLSRESKELEKLADQAEAARAASFSRAGAAAEAIKSLSSARKSKRVYYTDGMSSAEAEQSLLAGASIAGGGKGHGQSSTVSTTRTPPAMQAPASSTGKSSSGGKKSHKKRGGRKKKRGDEEL